jgi:recombination protein RecT
MTASSAALKTIATGQVAAPARSDAARTLAHLMASPRVKAQLALALPKHMTADRMARIVATELRRTPKLQECEPLSFLGAVIQCAQLGLEPGSALGHVYLLPFDKREKRGDRWVAVATECQVIVGYRGMIDLARRSGQIVSIEARAVYEGDHFECQFGLQSTLTHKPDWDKADRTDATLRCVYAVAHLRDGGVQCEVMSRREIDAIRSRSRAGNSGPWVTDFSAMALKTVIRRLFKYLPVSIEIQRAVALDEHAEAGLSQDLGSVIDASDTAGSPEPLEAPAAPDTPTEAAA